jgi:hypothetical protein
MARAPLLRRRKTNTVRFSFFNFFFLISLRAAELRRAFNELEARFNAEKQRADKEKQRADATERVARDVSCARLLVEGVAISATTGSTTSSHVDSSAHAPAVFAPLGENDVADVSDVYNNNNANHAWSTLPENFKRPSALLVQAIARDLAVANEADVAFLVNLMVGDLVGVLGLDWTVSAEKPVLKWRPDIFLLLKNGRIVGVIEVKKNGVAGGDKDPFTAAPVAGQLWDYVKLLEQCGIANAVAMLHTGSRAAIVKCAPGVERKLLMTAVADNPAAVIKMTLQYLRTAQRCSDAATDLAVDFGKSVADRLIRRVLKNGKISWATCSTSGLTFSHVPAYQAGDEILLWTELGRGSFGSCFLASIGEYALAIKVLFHRAESAEAPAVIVTAEDECNSIKSVYTEANGWSAKIARLFGASWTATRGNLQMVAMPLCTPLPLEQRQRRLPDVEAALKKLARSEKVYSFDKGDFGWRHVMTLQGEVVFVDFGLLVSVQSTVHTPEQWVEQAMRYLQETVDVRSHHAFLGEVALDPSNESSSSDGEDDNDEK